MKKKMLAVLVSSVMVLSMVGCGGGGETNSSSEVGEETTMAEQQNENESETEAAVDIPDFNTEATIEETVLLEENNVKITATGLTYTNYSVDLNLTLENNSDKTLSFISNSLSYNCNSVNGYMVDDGYMNVDVTPGNVANETVSFGIEGLMVYGITEVSDIQIGFDIEDENYEGFTSGPVQIKTSLYESHDYNINTYRESIENGVLEALFDCDILYDEDAELLNQENVQLLSATLISTAENGDGLLLEVKNNSDQGVYSDVRDGSVNGLILDDGSWAIDSINPGATRIIDISFDSMVEEEWLALYGISEIGNIEFAFSIEDSENNTLGEPQQISLSISDQSGIVDSTGDVVYNENGIQIISKGLKPHSSDLLGNIYMLFLIQNDSSSVIQVDEKMGSLSLNGVMTDCIGSSSEIPAGKSAIFYVEIFEMDLESSNIAGVDNVTEAQLTFEITDDSYNDIAEPTVTINYQQ